VGLGFRGWLTMFYLGFETRSLVQATVVATWSSGYIRHHVLHQLQEWKATVHSKNMKLKKTWNSKGSKASQLHIYKLTLQKKYLSQSSSIRKKHPPSFKAHHHLRILHTISNNWAVPIFIIWHMATEPLFSSIPAMLDYGSMSQTHCGTVKKENGSVMGHRPKKWPKKSSHTLNLRSRNHNNNPCSPKLRHNNQLFLFN
jgi:hypothetical protein